MSALIGGIGLYSGPPLVIRRQPAARTREKTTDEGGKRRSATEGALVRSQQWLKQALTVDGFFGFNIGQCESLRRFAQATATPDTSAVSSTIDYVLAALREHGYCNPTSSGTERMKVFVEPNEEQTGEPTVEIDTAAFLGAVQQITTQTADLIREQPETASDAQARVPGGAAVKLLL
jgi:hypothetical protein